MEQEVVSPKKQRLRNGRRVKEPPRWKYGRVFMTPAVFRLMVRVLQVIRYAAQAIYAVLKLFRD